MLLEKGSRPVLDYKREFDFSKRRGESLQESACFINTQRDSFFLCVAKL